MMKRRSATAILCLALAAACGREPDVHRMAEGALDSVALDDTVDAVYDSSADVVRLTGTVESEADRMRAEEVVHTAVGDLATVANEIVVERLDAEMADDLDTGIATRFETLVDNTPELASGEIEHRVSNGVLTVSGRVADEAHLVRVESLARSVPGVTDVVIAVTVDPTLAARPERRR